MASVTIRVPATTANLGPGFDTLGLALDVWNSLTVEAAEVSGDAAVYERNLARLICLLCLCVAADVPSGCHGGRP